LAIISQQLFQTAWDWFVAKRIEFMSFPGPVKEWMDDHKSRLIFYRQIACDNISNICRLERFGQNVSKLLQSVLRLEGVWSRHESMQIGRRSLTTSQMVSRNFADNLESKRVKWSNKTF
jgi:hypothetical protein